MTKRRSSSLQRYALLPKQTNPLKRNVSIDQLLGAGQHRIRRAMRAAHPSCHRNDAWNKASQNRPISPCKSQRRKGDTYKSQIAITLLERKHQMLTLQPSVRHETVPIGGNRHRGILCMTEIFRQSMAQVLYKTIGQTVPRHQSQHNHTKTKLFIAKCSRKRPHSREFCLSYFFYHK